MSKPFSPDPPPTPTPKPKPVPEPDALLSRTVQFVDAEGFVIQIPYKELVKFRKPAGAFWKVPRYAAEDGPDGGTPDGGTGTEDSRGSCEDTGDTGMTGCGG